MVRVGSIRRAGGLVGADGDMLPPAFWHSVLFASIIGLLALVQADAAGWMVP